MNIYEQQISWKVRACNRPRDQIIDEHMHKKANLTKAMEKGQIELLY